MNLKLTEQDGMPAGLPWPWCHYRSRYLSVTTPCGYALFPSQWHRMPTTQETDGFQVKRPGDLNVKCTLLLMLDHQVTDARIKAGPWGWGRGGKQVPQTHLDPVLLKASPLLCSVSSLHSTNWIPDWRGC